MRQVKPWYQSKTVWAAIGTVLAGGAGLLHHAAVDAKWASDFADWAVAASTLVTGAVSLYGRLTATQRIGDPAGPAGGPNPSELAAGSGTTAPVTGTTPLAWMALAGAALIASTALAGCAADPAFVGAERATYNAVAPEYLDYVRADPALSADQKARRERTLVTWDLSLRTHEEAATPPAGPAAPNSRPAERP